ncbi:anaerobic ribonucleoside-triphosphate reductase activating protein [Evansella caseinilytica]|uniref:Anaerobic ribonucleoside-triphosphate reductase-activating protein n=1 Tax=Evansella caseinilytica TaxID=1503961 RepID=A0A1H3RC15_9BACI|nr:anaerobic ribonucleoside-triphosphate reductase activating protein [Evansella caseinilytica]SDZ22865.1 anaerobic ribonucleoside-triphosphate reductase activating protein [Evansella caseinilytica]
MVKVLSVIHDSIVDGEGLRTVVFTAGCPHFCPGCHNPSSWNINNGKEYSEEELVHAISVSESNDVTFSGGDPFFQAAELVPVARRVKEMGKSLWIYTGYTLEQLLERMIKSELILLALADTIVDGPYIEAERDLTLPFRGSRNQRIIPVTGELRSRAAALMEESSQPIC